MSRLVLLVAACLAASAAAEEVEQAKTAEEGEAGKAGEAVSLVDELNTVLHTKTADEVHQAVGRESCYGITPDFWRTEDKSVEFCDMTTSNSVYFTVSPGYNGLGMWGVVRKTIVRARVQNLIKANETYHVKIRNYGSDGLYQCESVTLISKYETSWSVRFRHYYNTKLRCYDTSVQVSNGENGNKLLTYKLQREENKQEHKRELIYAGGDSRCFILGSPEENGGVRNSCELLVPESLIKEMTEDCVDQFKTLCGPKTIGSYRGNCLEEPEDKESCPRLPVYGC